MWRSEEQQMEERLAALSFSLYSGTGTATCLVTSTSRSHFPNNIRSMRLWSTLQSTLRYTDEKC